jgi:hypothetical protein
MNQEIKKTNKLELIIKISFFLFFGIGAYIVAPEAWGFYTIIIPVFFLHSILVEYGSSWSANKKLFILKYIFLLIITCILAVLGSYIHG